MTHTLESLKKILDEGGTIIKGRRKFCKKDGQYHFDSGFGNSGPCSTLFLEYALSKGEWSELKADPSTITVPIDQWNALNKELGDLRTKSHKSFIDEALDAIKAKMDDIYKEHEIVPLMSQNQTLDPAAEYEPNWKGTAPIGATYYLLEIYSLLITGPHTKGVLDVFLHQFHMEFPTMEAAQKEVDMMKQYRAPVRNTEEIKKGWDEFSIAMYRKAVEDSTKPYTFLALPAAEIMVGIKSGQTWTNGYYTSSGCNEIGIYFDHKFGTTSVPWELVAGFIEENKIWEKK